MANCCTCLSKSANIIFCLLLFIIGGFVAGVGIWYLVSDYKDWVPEWWIWIAVVTGILLAILSFVGCYGSLKRNKCVLSFLWVASTVLFILFAIAAIASTIFFAGVDNLNGKTAQQLLEVSGNDGNVYKQIRDGYIAVFTDDDCNVKCSVDDGKLYCGSITCESEAIEDQLNRWIGPSWWTTDVNSFEKCVAAATVEDNPNEMAAEAWRNGVLFYNAFVFAAGGVVAGIAIWYLQAKFRRLMQVWNDEGCDLTCDIGNTTVSCSTVQCSTSKIAQQMNQWIAEGNYQTRGVPEAVTFQKCLDETILTDGINRNKSAAQGWCSGNASVVDDVSHYALGAMIGLWVALLISMVPMVYDLYLLWVLRKRRAHAYTAHEDLDENGGIGEEEDGPKKTPPQTVTVVQI
ncbi:conserved hypothetical protein [Perkinsus marinus ATCC 50983]|uniref:Uncharacterized protein n=1 Tax=Perkinsus marinus (strain ATCC 50983 / TXsc) TaxID=423536 RepID=C5KLY5_PERM5|nr:conserved hypothetical protein [Perkinsus marinus ATCC 50983]EER14500.1 conserved hypothetical protein [Perkinsus marinus ATCC 50983]|eukprot:XP_002782705.1 conserved hypothetical protein [Perkinsus marinus ATCC 50983]